MLFIESSFDAIREPTPFGAGARVTQPRHTKLAAMLDDFFAGKIRSFKQCYIEATGDSEVSGQIEDVVASRYCEAMGTPFNEAIDSNQWSHVLGGAMRRALLQAYRIPDSKFDSWRKIVRVVSRADFRAEQITQVGGYPDVPTVAQGAPYLPLPTPADWGASYGVQKRGGTETVSVEAIRNDDAEAIRRMPVDLARAAKRTLARFVFDFFVVNPTIYDGLPLFDPSHDITGSAALDATSLAARRLAVLRRTELSSSDRIGIPPRYLLVPPDEERTAWNLVRQRGINRDPSFEQSRGLEVIVVWFWSDANDWGLVVDPADMAGIEIGFLDSKEDPRLFVQDLPNVGSLFSHDSLTYKLRQIYGGTVVDFRALDKSIVPLP